MISPPDSVVGYKRPAETQLVGPSRPFSFAGALIRNAPRIIRGARQVYDMVRRNTYSSRNNYRRPKYRNRKPKQSVSNTVTAQRDFNTQYRKKYMGRGKKRQWMKFVKKVNAVVNKDLGLRTVVFNDNITANTSGVTDQQALGFHLYGNRGASLGNTLGANDLIRVFSNDPDIDQSVGPLNPRIGKLMFGSAVIDMTINNVGQTDVELDLYFGFHRKDVTNTNLIADLTDATLEEPINNLIPNTSLDILKRGVTPFDLPTGISQSGFSILKKQKVLLKVGQQTFIQHRDPRNHVIEWNNIKLTGYAVRKLTFSILAVYKPIVGFTEGNANLAFGVTRKYSYTANVSNLDVSALNP